MVITDDKNSIVDLKDREYFRSLLPYINYYFVYDRTKNLEKTALWEGPYSEESVETVVVKVGEAVATLPFFENMAQMAVFKDIRSLSGNSLPEISIYDYRLGQFQTVKDAELLPTGSAYSQKLNLGNIIKSLPKQANSSSII